MHWFYMWQISSTRTLESPGGGEVLGGLGFFASVLWFVVGACWLVGPCVLVGLSFYDLNKVIIQFLFGKRLGMRFNTILIFRFPSETTTINMS